MANPGPSDPNQKSGNAVNPDAKSIPLFSDADYQPILENWYTAKPYGFKFTPKSGTPLVMFLPLNPNNITVTTHFATNIVPTLYGTVEEHSPVRYYDITIEGTTGIGPRYVQPFAWQGKPDKKTMRSRFTVQQTINTAGFLSKTIATAQNVAGETVGLFKSPEVSTGLQLDQTGYLAFHNFYRFLLKYKKDASSNEDRSTDDHPLTFFNYKDNNQYKVVVRSMTMRRDKEDPMMYHYSLVMRGYDLADASEASSKISKDENLLDQLGLSGVDGSTFLGEAKKKASQAKGILGSTANGINQLGR